MDRDVLIRRSAEFAFVALLAVALRQGGGSVLAGGPRFVDALLPSMAAQASADAHPLQKIARLSLPELPDSRFAPQLLYPVTQNAFPDWLKQPRARGTHPVIAICIDDLGEDIAGTDKAMALPKEVALSFLPFAESTPFLAEEARAKGHMILAHVPMQAVSATDPGPMALMPGMAVDEVTRRLAWDIARVPGLSGINNHEGSRFTADAAALAPVVATLKARGLFFFDSRTVADSKVVAVSQAAGVMSAGRDVFLDDDQSETAITAQLNALAAMAKAHGVAIAIGHPHEATLRLLAAWLKQDHGVTLVPLSEAMRMKAGHETVSAMR